MQRVRNAYLAIIDFTERLTVYFTLIMFVLMGNNLTADVTYEMSTYFNILQFVVAYFSQGLLGESIVSFSRLEDFLLMDEVNTRHFSENTPQLQFKSQKPKEKTNAENQIDRYISKNGSICLNIYQGQLCAVVGAVGSGRSSILHLLLKELNCSISTKNSIALTLQFLTKNNTLMMPQPPLRILFDQSYDMARYMQIIFIVQSNCCGSKCMMKDFRQFPQGDMTMVVDRGVFLSGGQRTLINFARAVYRQADVYLLDDPLIAVVTRVARRLYGKCIIEYLHGKTRILVIHQLQFLKRVHHVVVLDRHSDTDYSDYVENSPEDVGTRSSSRQIIQGISA
ncbi:Multidrug resistance-associated protein 4 [Trachymyrmex septentrionalis]|uniref:Multidrug resistance-associated protein 4 n=1 Tax=Trachymyrmex septentrionalis TaxID=34720 RepID=A0A151JYL8_9HYME|nr:Multidrug resistance-associated protein 4 [Trachymyrmex septentrionalis]